MTAAVILATYPVVTDTTLTSLYVSFGVVVFASLFMIPSLKSKWTWLFFLTFLTLGLFLALALLAPYWKYDVTFVEQLPYDASYQNIYIDAQVEIKIGLTNFNVTLLGRPEFPPEYNGTERVNYNERFEWDRQTHPFPQEYLEALEEGLPWPITQVIEAMIQDGDHLRWGRMFRLSGYYTSVLLWVALASWFASAILAFGNLFYAGAAMVSVIVFTILAIATYTIANAGNEYHIYLEGSTLYPRYSWAFGLAVISVILASILALILFTFDSMELFVRKSEREAEIMMIKAEAMMGTMMKKKQVPEDDESNITRGREGSIIVAPQLAIDGTKSMKMAGLGVSMRARPPPATMTTLAAFLLGPNRSPAALSPSRRNVVMLLDAMDSPSRKDMPRSISHAIELSSEMPSSGTSSLTSTTGEIPLNESNTSEQSNADVLAPAAVSMTNIVPMVDMSSNVPQSATGVEENVPLPVLPPRRGRRPSELPPVPPAPSSQQMIMELGTPTEMIRSPTPPAPTDKISTPPKSVKKSVRFSSWTKMLVGSSSNPRRTAADDGSIPTSPSSPMPSVKPSTINISL
eukprot:CAMPEP_0184646188 /NCGR_PEP_ID=MMETSP0308-20130426/2843_1 /TAXON_ID=38269 /ORGANISM="Gloeochaete witrockiana, Strain SAG 46.84" /LENGTH=573 /DNA_ID=CAMNT_0027075963 /DNA_START=220 /DNA_END=1941 /DNA_ORIENTATION=+